MIWLPIVVVAPRRAKHGIFTTSLVKSAISTFLF